jgi:transcriptional regulator with XRE-family HTH domain
MGEQVRIVRSLRRMSQKALADKTGLTQFVISFIETNRANPTEAQLTAIRAALNWTDAEDAALALLGGQDRSCPREVAQ